MDVRTFQQLVYPIVPNYRWLISDLLNISISLMENTNTTHFLLGNSPTYSTKNTCPTLVGSRIFMGTPSRRWTPTSMTSCSSVLRSFRHQQDLSPRCSNQDSDAAMLSLSFSKKLCFIPILAGFSHFRSWITMAMDQNHPSCPHGLHLEASAFKTPAEISGHLGIVPMGSKKRVRKWSHEETWGYKPWDFNLEAREVAGNSLARPPALHLLIAIRISSEKTRTMMTITN